MGYTIWPDGHIWPDGSGGDAVSDVYRERLRQEELRRKGKFPWTCATTSRTVTAEARFAVLSEEVGEVARHVTEGLIDKTRLDRAKLREELIQVAAVAVAWAEALAEKETDE